MNTAKALTEFGRHDGSDTVTLSALKTKLICTVL